MFACCSPWNFPSKVCAFPTALQLLKGHHSRTENKQLFYLTFYALLKPYVKEVKIILSRWLVINATFLQRDVTSLLIAVRRIIQFVRSSFTKHWLGLDFFQEKGLIVT